MESEQARFLFQDLNSLSGVLAMVWFILAFGLTVAVWAGWMRTLPFRSRLLMLAVSGVACLFLPVGVARLAGAVFAGFLLFLSLAFLVVVTPWGRRKLNAFGLRAQLRRRIENGYRLTPARLSRGVETATVWFEGQGFLPLMRGLDGVGAMTSILFRPGDGVVAQVLRARLLRLWPSVSVTVRSFVVDHRGVFATTGFGGNAALDDRQSALAQVVPSAGPDVLLATHVEGMRLLEAQGVRFHTLNKDIAFELLEWAARLSATLLKASDEELSGLFERQLRAQAQRTRILPSMADDPVVRRRIDAFVG